MERKVLPYLIAISALSVSLSAAFYSVTGLSKMFAGAATQVMVMAGSLEIAKLVLLPEQNISNAAHLLDNSRSGCCGVFDTISGCIINISE